ncbi:hypothetical protein E4U43_006224 [Claviceps pusilla]|uniref:Uncharacterized protein n=1 Tax=Claviceps pusilla TaxID=123648 RepID=A0A9P7NDZ7_9HYPO|nr:hypothetical protein E4U43_006224 [Claviceps pusilla]
MGSKPVDIPPRKPQEEVHGPGSQYCGSVYCGSPQLVTKVTSTGELIETWGVPPKPGHETLFIPRPPPKASPDKKRTKKKK